MRNEDEEIDTRRLMGIVGKWVGFVALGIFALVLAVNAFGTVDAGKVGLYNRYGQIADETASPGLVTMNPFTTNLETMDVTSLRWDGLTPAYTQDLQQADVSFAVTYRLDRGQAAQMRKTVGTEWANRLIPPVVHGSVKNIFAQYTAMNAVARRPEIQQRIFSVVRDRLNNRGVIIESFELTNLDYSDQFEGAVEAAAVATQKAVAAKNATVRVQEEAKQKEIQAAAEANAIRIQAQAISTNPEIVQMRAVEKWNGVLPGNMYGANAIPFIQQR